MFSTAEYMFTTAEYMFATAEYNSNAYYVEISIGNWVIFRSAERIFRSGEHIFRSGEHMFRSAEYKSNQEHQGWEIEISAY